MLRCGLLGETLGHSYSPMIHHELGEDDYKKDSFLSSAFRENHRNKSWN